MNLPEKQEFDVIIIGGGVIGLSIARELKKQGVRNIAILEKNIANGMEASYAAAGMLAPQSEAQRADDFFLLCAQSRDLYANFAAELRAETNIDIELEQSGTLCLAFNEHDLAELEQRFAWQTAADLPVEKLSAQDVLELEPNVSPEVLGALRFPFDWQVQNRYLNRALFATLHDSTFFFKETEVERLLFANNCVVGIETEQTRLFARRVVVAAGAWSSLLKTAFEPALEVKPIRGQIVAFTAASRLFRHVIYSARGYVVPRLSIKNSLWRILIGATIEDAGFEKKTTGAGLASLLQIGFEISPQFKTLTMTDSWAGLRPQTPDGLPLLGEFPRNSGLYFATGHYRNGILLAPITAKLIADKIVRNVDSPFLEIFNPGRFSNNS